MAQICQFAHASIGNIDTEAGLIRGVSLITTGEVLGYDVWADQTTLITLMSSALTYQNGLKVKLNHSQNVGDIVGYIDNFSIESAHLRGDLHLLEHSASAEYVLELAQTIPESIGLSVAFSYELEKVDGLALPAVRCLEIYSCDLVDTPAANPNGLFSKMKTEEKTETTPTPEPAPTPAEPGPEKVKTPEPEKEPAPTAQNPRMAELEATVSSLSTLVQSFQTIVDGIVRAQEVQATEFAAKLKEQRAEFTLALKDADILAARKLAATGVPAEKGKALASGSGVVLNHIATLEAMEDPQERMIYFQKHRVLISQEYARRK